MSDALTDLKLESPPGPMTHRQLVRRMALWLKNSRGYSVVIAERATSVRETPDVLGFHQSQSLLIECKVSRADFMADRDKSFRVYAAAGMGDRRYFAAPAGILRADDLPENWGLLEVRNRQVHEVLGAIPQEANKRAEVTFLVSAIRRLEISCAVFVQHDEPAGQPTQLTLAQDETLTTADEAQ